VKARERHVTAWSRAVLLCLLLTLPIAAGCDGKGGAADGGPLDVVASATFLADIAQNVAGDRFTVLALVPADADLHAFEATPRDIADVADADLFIVNGAGLEQTLEDTVREAGGGVRVVRASEGLTTRTPRPGEPQGDAVDPHFWLDPTLVETYVENIRAAFAAVDPAGAATYAENATAYTEELEALDRWIAAQVGPEMKRRGMRFVGLDVIGDWLTEVNVTSPTCIRELDAQFGLNIAGQLFDAIERGAPGAGA